MSATDARIASSPVHSALCRSNEKDGRAFKCTFCLDRQKVGLDAGMCDGLSD